MISPINKTESNSPIPTTETSNYQHTTSPLNQSKSTITSMGNPTQNIVHQNFTAFLDHVNEKGHTWKDKLLDLVVNYHEATDFLKKALFFPGLILVHIWNIPKESSHYKDLKRQSDFFHQMNLITTHYKKNPEESCHADLEMLTQDLNYSNLETLTEILKKETGQESGAHIDDMKLIKESCLSATLQGTQELTQADLPASMTVDQAQALRDLINNVKKQLTTAKVLRNSEIQRIDGLKITTTSNQKQELSALVGLRSNQVRGSKEHLKEEALAKYGQSVDTAMETLIQQGITFKETGDISFSRFIS